MSEVDRRRAVLELAAEASGLGTFDWDLVTRQLIWDQRLLDLFGYDAGSFSGTIEGFNARVHPGDLARVDALLRQAIATCGEYEAEFRIVLPDGTNRWIAARGRALTEGGTEAARLIGVAYDATARRDPEGRVARVLGSLGMAFFALDREWRFSFVNSEAERVLQRRREELLGGVIWDLFPAAIGSEFERCYRRAMDDGEEVAFDAYYPDPLNAWYEVRAWPGPDGLAVYFLDITQRRQAHIEAQRAVSRAALLARVSATLSGVSASGVKSAAKGLARVVVPELADWAIVTLVDDDSHTGTRQGLLNAGGWHVDPSKRDLVERYASARLGEIVDDSIVVRAVEAGQVQHLRGDAFAQVQELFEPGVARECIEQLHPYCVLLLPLVGTGAPLGILTMCNEKARGDFTPDDVQTAYELAARAGILLDSARLYRRQRAIAEGLQRAHLTEPPKRDDVEIAVRYAPASEVAQVGGDWYDAFVDGAERLTVVIGDVMGHDVEAAAAMGQVRTLVRGMAAVAGDGPAEILRKVDSVMSRLGVATTASAVVGQLEAQPAGTGRSGTQLTWSNAGHPPPMVLRASGGVEVLAAVGGGEDILLGVESGASRHEEAVHLDAGDVVVFYTDGLVERRDQSLVSGLDHLVDVLGLLAGRDLDELCDEVLARCLPDSRGDDVAVVAVRLLR